MIGPAAVRYDADLTYVAAMKDGELPNDGTLAELPLTSVPDQSGMSVKGDGLMPTIHFRRDLQEFQMPDVATTLLALSDARIGGDWEIMPTPLGNLALLRRDPGPLHDLWYAGYIDLATGEVVLYDGDPAPLPQLGENYPFRGAMRRIDGLCHEETLEELRGDGPCACGGEWLMGRHFYPDEMAQGAAATPVAP